MTCHGLLKLARVNGQMAHSIPIYPFTRLLISVLARYDAFGGVEHIRPIVPGVDLIAVTELGMTVCIGYIRPVLMAIDAVQLPPARPGLRLVLRTAAARRGVVEDGGVVGPPEGIHPVILNVAAAIVPDHVSACRSRNSRHGLGDHVPVRHEGAVAEAAIRVFPASVADDQVIRGVA